LSYGVQLLDCKARYKQYKASCVRTRVGRTHQADEGLAELVITQGLREGQEVCREKGKK
jgi:hypothetical protein